MANPANPRLPTRRVQRAQHVHIPNWHEIDPNAKYPPPKGYPLPLRYLRYLRHEGIEFLKELGSGSFGSVWRVRITKRDKNKVRKIVAACKVISLHTYDSRYYSLTEASILMMSEANIHKDISHPHLVRCEQVMHLEDLKVRQISYPYMHVLIFMEHCDGDLSDYLHGIHRYMSEPEAYDWFVQVADALRYLHRHRHIAHMDIKLENILIKKDRKHANHAIVKLGDFGLAKQFDADQVYSSGATGTRGYMAPEVVVGHRYDPYRADIYSLAFTLVFTLVGLHDQDVDEMVRDISVRFHRFANARDYFANKWMISGMLLDLLVGMLDEDPGSRFDIERVWSDDWVRQKAYVSGQSFYLAPA